MFTLESFMENERTGYGNVGRMTANASDMMSDPHFDTGLMRPYRDQRGRVWVDVCVGSETVKDSSGFPVTNKQGLPKQRAVYEPQLVSERRAKDLPVINFTSNATVLSKDQWMVLDTAVLTASRKRMRAWADLRASNTMGGIDGMSTPVLAFERLTDAGEAIVDMDGMTEGRNFAPKFALDGMALPITHSDFFLSQRFLSTSQARGGAAADTLRAEMSARRVGETIEQTLIGSQTLTHIAGDIAAIGGTSGQTGPVYGYLNHPDRITKTNMTTPTGSNGPTVLSEWLAVRELMYAQNFYGPFMIYCSSDYDQHLDNLFSTTEPSAGTLRSRLLQIEGVQDIRRLDYLTAASNPYTLIWTQMGDEIQAVNGMEVTTLQWESMGGMRLNFKVMGIQVPRIRSVNVNTGTTGPASSATAKAPICVATTS